jgi:hypothetical protein
VQDRIVEICHCGSHRDLTIYVNCRPGASPQFVCATGPKTAPPVSNATSADASGPCISSGGQIAIHSQIWYLCPIPVNRGHLNGPAGTGPRRWRLPLGPHRKGTRQARTRVPTAVFRQRCVMRKVIHIRVYAD